jgi:FlaA1/EpsC-like NDP-sugar epimerase
LVALAYYLAFHLRFENGLGGANDKYGDLLTHTIFWVVPLSLAVLAGFGQYQRLWTFVGQRDYEAVVKGVVVATLLIVGATAFLHPVTTNTAGQATPVTLPGSVIALFLLLALAFLIGARFLVHLVVEGRVRSFRAAKGARDALIVGGGDGGRLVVRELIRNPQLRLRPVGFVDDDPRKLGMKDEHGLKVVGTSPRRGRAGRSGDRDPVRAWDASGSSGGGLPRARHPGAHHAHRVRTAQRQHGPSERDPPAARGAGRGHPRP